MAEAGPGEQQGRLPTLEEAVAWTGFEVDEAGGARVGRVHGVYADAGGDGGPAWLVVALARRGLLPAPRGPVLVAVPVRDCAAAAGRVWTAHDRGALSRAPTVDPARPLLREHELTICAHYGIGAAAGRAAELAGRAEGSVTAAPA